MIERLIVFSPARDSGAMPELPERTWFIRGDLVKIDPHKHVYKLGLESKSDCPNTIGKVYFIYGGGKLGDAGCTERGCLYMQQVEFADRIRRS